MVQVRILRPVSLTGMECVRIAIVSSMICNIKHFYLYIDDANLLRKAASLIGRLGTVV